MPELDLDAIDQRAASLPGDVKDWDTVSADTPALVAEVRKLRARIADAAAEWDAGMYGDPEVTFRMMAHLTPEQLGKTIGVDLDQVKVPLREEVGDA